MADEQNALTAGDLIPGWSALFGPELDLRGPGDGPDEMTLWCDGERYPGEGER